MFLSSTNNAFPSQVFNKAPSFSTSIWPQKCSAQAVRVIASDKDLYSAQHRHTTKWRVCFPFIFKKTPSEIARFKYIGFDQKKTHHVHTRNSQVTDIVNTKKSCHSAPPKKSQHHGSSDHPKCSPPPCRKTLRPSTRSSVTWAGFFGQQHLKMLAWNRNHLHSDFRTLPFFWATPICLLERGAS